MNVFDMIGPVMIGPSSSHTAGAARLGLAAALLLDEPPVEADILLHGSFAQTYKGHGTDKALVAGILGMKPDDSRLPESLALAARQGLAVRLQTGQLENAHPNTARITLRGRSGRSVTMQGASVGGGAILITQVNGMDVKLTGEQPGLVVLHRDAPGTIAAVTELLAAAGLNICGFRLSRQEKGGMACMSIELEGQPSPSLRQEVAALPNVMGCTLLAAL